MHSVFWILWMVWNNCGARPGFSYRGVGNLLRAGGMGRVDDGGGVPCSGSIGKLHRYRVLLLSIVVVILPGSTTVGTVLRVTQPTTLSLRDAWSPPELGVPVVEL